MKNTDSSIKEPRDECQESGLRYVTSTQRGYSRIIHNEQIQYLDQNGKLILNERTLDRIQRLAIPPAWKDVWICASADGHLQATGIDLRSRKQYIYHTRWRALRSEKKFSSLRQFGKKLPRLKTQVTKDLRRKKLTRDKVCALAIAIMDKTSFRAGNKHYENNYGSFGLTTLHNKHIRQLSANKLFFKFVGKKGVSQQSFLRDKTLIRVLMRVKEIPGQSLFQYYDDEGNIRPIDSGIINNYLKEAMDMEVSCKNFRTWNGCLLALENMINLPLPQSQTERKKNILTIIDKVAEELGNTRSVTRSYYIHPHILSAYEKGDLDKWIVSMQTRNQFSEKTLRTKLLKLLAITE